MVVVIEPVEVDGAAFFEFCAVAQHVPERDVALAGLIELMEVAADGVVELEQALLDQAMHDHDRIGRTPRRG